jgi:hypothetical protein
MIHLEFALHNPWSERWQNIKVFHKAITKNKSIELQCMKTNDIISCIVNFTIRQDHAGLNTYLALFGYSIKFSFHDNRHWNYETNTWETYDENINS